MANNSGAASLNTFTSRFKITTSTAPKTTRSMPSLAPAESQHATAAPADAPAPPPTAAFGVLTTTESKLSDASNPHRDGRIRNPVPSKLKGKTDGSKGNFSVMHMDVAGRTEATERDAEAKRTSESTELAAKRAFENGYVSQRRNRFVQIPDEIPPKPFIPAATPTRTPAPNSSPPAQPTRMAPLSPEETKSEQARLLTLLRSLHPVLVVDQICKALAFFGGIPGAPPPADGVFPPSAESNGSGSLFVGWIAEIFPKLGGNGAVAPERAISPVNQPKSAPVAAPAVATAPVIGRRKRGRPKGSKGTKPRVDKGVKKGPVNKNSPASGQQQPGDAGDESWVDVDDDGMEAPDDIDANVLLLAQASTPQPQYEGHSVPHASGPTLQRVSTPARTALPGISTGPPAPADLTASAKRRGRPKGSKNRPRDSAADSLNSHAAQQPQTFSQMSQMPQGPSQPSQPPQITSTPQINSLLQRQSFTAVNAVPSVSPASAKKGKKTAGSKQRPPGQPTQTASGLGSGAGAASSTSANAASVQSLVTIPTSSHNSHAKVHQTPKALPATQTPGLTLPTPPTASPALANPPTTSAGQKRKRKPVKDSAPLQDSANGEASRTNASPQVNGLTLPTPPNNTGPPYVTTTATTTATTTMATNSQIPPAKRQRKGKNQKLPGNSSKATTAVAGITEPDDVPARASAPLTIQNPSSDIPRPEQSQMSAPVPSEPAMPSMSSLHSPQQTHFEVQSPTMENYEAQLQAQLEQQTELEPQAVTHYSRVDSAQSMASRHQQQQQQQRQQQSQFQQRQQQSQQPSQQMQQQQQHHTSTSHSKSPSIQSTKSQTSTPLLTGQKQTRNSYSQYQYTQPQQTQQTQQTYNSSQTHQSSSSQQQQQQQQQPQFVSQQQHGQGSQPSSAQQYSSNVTQTQPQQYSSTQQSYATTQQQFSNGQQQQQAPQQRYQQQLSTSSATAPYSTHQSPQFGTTTTNNYNANADGTYRSPGTSLGASSYNQRSQSGTPSTAASFRANSGHSLSHHSPSYSTGTNTVQSQQRSASTSHNSTQSMQGISSTMQAFAGSTGTDWGLFDASQLDTSGQQAAMGLSNPSYGLGTTNVRASNNAGAAFTAGLANFDGSGLGGNDRYYNVGRR
ncbi:hypothetical protein QBC44DRAFT_18297 [Cladorrhinum sp. PSN332]|nr:hypothetical protein QBC44DRAFT_18297 [Cladorrhinum sp. PSN332]